MITQTCARTPTGKLSLFWRIISFRHFSSEGKFGGVIDVITDADQLL